MMQDLPVSPGHLDIVMILTIGSILATVFGYFTDRIKLSPILGYLLAGYFIGPYSPGFVANAELSEQLAEIGVILMMFWVGIHIKWQELVHVKNLAVFGALAQTLFSTIVGVILIKSIGWSLEAAIIIGISIGIASTVVMVRVLSDNKLQNTPAGYISLSWLICEDFLAVFCLLLLPILAGLKAGESIEWHDLILSFAMILLKFVILVGILFTFGRRIVSFILNKIIGSRSHELFTLATLAITFAITVGFALFTGTSIALGAFIAGMLIGQTALHTHISANLMPLRDAFVVFFFLSIGMLFNPIAVGKNFFLFLGLLAIILIVKPLVASVIVRFWKYPNQVALGVALALAQIGEFSFILAEEAARLKLLPDAGYDLIIACALISLALNPLLFKLLGKYKNTQD